MAGSETPPQDPQDSHGSQEVPTFQGVPTTQVTTMAEASRNTPRKGFEAFLAGRNTAGGYQQRWGSNLTPQVLTTAQRQADMGNMTAISDILDELRDTDPHLHAVLAKREWTVAGAEWEVRQAAVFARGEEPPEAREIRTFVENALRGVPYFKDRLADLMGAIYYGRAVVEVLWRQEGGYVWPAELLQVHPRMVHFGSDWRVRLYSDGLAGGPPPFGPWPGVPLDESPAGKFITHTPRIRGGFTAREGLGRPLSWYCMFKRWVVRDAMALAEMAGKLGRIGTYMTGAQGGLRASDEDVKKLESTLLNWTSAQAMVHADTTTVRFEKPVAGDTIHKPLIDTFNSEMSKAVLGETLTTEAGNRGARSLGEIHARQARITARYDAAALAETVRRCLIAPLVAYNFGAKAPVPQIAFVVEPPEGLIQAAELVAKLARAGLKIPQVWVRNRFGIADPRPGEELLLIGQGSQQSTVAEWGPNKAPKAGASGENTFTEDGRGPSQGSRRSR